jgi:zinc protease
MRRAARARRSIALSSVCALALLLAARPSYAQTVARVRLDNGLDVILDENHCTPRVAVFVEYHVGSRDQPAGYTGLAHTTEHLMFSWARGARRGAAERLDALGATEVIGETDADQTRYGEVVASTLLEAALAFESDRMGFLLDHIDDTALASARRVVLREGVDRDARWPVAGFEAMRAEVLYPEGHPYRAVFERPDDVRALSLDHVRWFFQRWYVPSNATLVIVGDFEPRAALALVQRSFGGLARVARPQRAATTPLRAPRERGVIAATRARFDAIVMDYLVPAEGRAGSAELDLLADALEGGGVSRLGGQLSRDGVAQHLVVANVGGEFDSRFVVEAVASGDHSVRELLATIDTEVERLRAVPLSTAELDGLRAVRRVRWRTTASSLEGRARVLASIARRTQTESELRAQDVDRYQSVTAASVHEAARRWLVSSQRSVSLLFARQREERLIPVPNGPAIEFWGLR